MENTRGKRIKINPIDEYSDIKNYFESLSRYELKELLIKCGCEVEDGEGLIILSDKSEK